MARFFYLLAALAGINSFANAQAQDAPETGSGSGSISTVIPESFDFLLEGSGSVAQIQGQFVPKELESVCQSVNFQEKTGEIYKLNEAIDLANNVGAVPIIMEQFDPYVMRNATYSPVPFKVLGVEFEVVPTVDHFEAHGAKTVQPHVLTVKNESILGFSANFSGELSASGTITLSIRQVQKKWYIPCYTSMFHPINCPPLDLSVDVSLGFKEPSFSSDIHVAMLECIPGAPDCKDFSFDSIIHAAVEGTIMDELHRIPRHMQEIVSTDVQFAFEEMSSLNFKLHSSGKLMTSLAQQLWGYIQSVLNRKEREYNALVNLTQRTLQQIINSVIASFLGSSFGNTCLEN